MTAVLFVRLSAMGDVVQGLGAVAALHRVRPDWDLVFATQPAFAPLLQGFPGVAAVVPFGRRDGLGGVFALRRALRAWRFDHVLDLQGNWKSAMVARLAPARHRLGMAARWRQEPTSRWLLSSTIDCDGVPHPARAAYELVRAIAPEAPFLLPQLQATEVEKVHERAALAAIGIDAARRFEVVVVTAANDPRALRPGRIAEFIQRAKVPVVQLLGPAEAAVAAPTTAPMLRHERGELRRLVALGAILAANGGQVFGPDQGATHVLAAAGATTRVLSGAQDPRRSSPPGATSHTHPSPPACSPCRRRRCEHAEGPVCMDFPLDGGRPVGLGLPSPQQLP